MNAVPSAAARILDVPVTDQKTGIFSPMGRISLNAVIHADIHVGDYVAVFGQGVRGLMATHLACANGASPSLDHRRDRMGLDKMAMRLQAEGESISGN